jgi:hypothetical protein
MGVIPTVPILPGAAVDRLWVVPGRLSPVVSAIPYAAVHTPGSAVPGVCNFRDRRCHGGRSLKLRHT